MWGFFKWGWGLQNFFIHIGNFVKYQFQNLNLSDYENNLDCQRPTEDNKMCLLINPSLFCQLLVFFIILLVYMY